MNILWGKLKSKMEYNKDEIMEFESEILKNSNGNYLFKNTFFYPGGGHQACDIGEIVINNDTYQVKKVYQYNGEIWHSIEGKTKIPIGTKFKAIINKKRRNYLSNLHTAQHILARIVFNKYKINTISADMNVSGGSITFAQPIKKEWLFDIEKEFQNIVLRKYPVYKEVENDIITVSIGDFDKTLCAGTHAKNTGHLSNIILLGNGKKDSKIEFDCIQDKEFGVAAQAMKELFRIYGEIGKSSEKSDIIIEKIKGYENLRKEIALSIEKNKEKLERKNFNVNDKVVSIFNICAAGEMKKIFRRLINEEKISDDCDISIYILENIVSITINDRNLSGTILMDKLRNHIMNVRNIGGSKKYIHLRIEEKNSEIVKQIERIVKEYIYEQYEKK